MSLSDSDMTVLSVIWLISALFVCVKVIETFCIWITYLYEQCIIVDSQTTKIGFHLHTKVYYRHGVGCERVVDGHKRVISTRPFRWERAVNGEIHEVEQ